MTRHISQLVMALAVVAAIIAAANVPAQGTTTGNKAAYFGMLGQTGKLPYVPSGSPYTPQGMTNTNNNENPLNSMLSKAVPTPNGGYSVMYTGGPMAGGSTN